MSGRELLLNADFDLSLRRRWQAPDSPRWQRQVAELAAGALIEAGPGDTVLLSTPPPPSHLEALSALGLTIPAWSVLPAIRPEQCFCPAGWSPATAELNQRYRRPAPHPPLEVVRAVNGRAFSADLDRSGSTVAVAGTAAAVEDAIARDAGRGGCGWVIKSFFGNAALGNRRVRRSALGEAERRWLESVLEQDEGVVVERWRDRRLDLCATFEVSPAGAVGEPTVHEAVNTADGAFLGALYEARAEAVAPWVEPLAAAVESVGRALAGAGYFGPVCLDAFVWWDGAGPVLRPVVDINARRHASRPAWALWQRLGGSGAAYWRFYNRSRLTLPDDERELPDRLGDDAFDGRAGVGSMLTSPLAGDGPRPLKAAVLHLAADRAGVLALDRRFRRRFERGFPG